MKKPTEKEVHDAVRTMLAWAGDDPSREGLIETPKRVAEAYKEFLQVMKPTLRNFRKDL